MARVVIITGGTRGIGAALSVAFNKAGYRVAAVYQASDEAAQSFSNENGIDVFKWVVGNYAACQAGIEEVQKKFGPICILVNNAGITRDSMFHKMTIEQWHEVIDVNFNSCFNMSRGVIELMRERGFGRIINVSSVNGLKGQIGQTNYSAAKAGLIGFTKALAQESANKGITVNAIAPGYIATEMVSKIPEAVLEKIRHQIPVGRLGLPEEVARTALFLAHDDASFITGATINVNGGQYMV